MIPTKHPKYHNNNYSKLDKIDLIKNRTVTANRTIRLKTTTPNKRGVPMGSKLFARRNRHHNTSNNTSNNTSSNADDLIPTPWFLRPSILLPLMAVAVVGSWNLFLYTKTNVNIPLESSTSSIYKVETTPTYFVGKKNQVTVLVSLQHNNSDTTNPPTTRHYVVYPPVGTSNSVSNGDIGGNRADSNGIRFRISSPTPPNNPNTNDNTNANTTDRLLFTAKTTGTYRIYFEDNGVSHLLYTVRSISDPFSNPILIGLLISFALMVGFFRKMFRRERNFTFLFIYATVFILICFGAFGVVQEMNAYKSPSTAIEQLL